MLTVSRLENKNEPLAQINLWIIYIEGGDGDVSEQDERIVTEFATFTDFSS